MIKLVMTKMSPAGDSKRLAEIFATVAGALESVCVPGLECLQGVNGEIGSIFDHLPNFLIEPFIIIIIIIIIISSSSSSSGSCSSTATAATVLH
jgi:hypothetical protein